MSREAALLSCARMVLMLLYFLSGKRYEPLASSKCLFIVFNDKDAFTFWEVVG